MLENNDQNTKFAHASSCCLCIEMLTNADNMGLASLYEGLPLMSEVAV